jgi:hypothetical protein
LHQIDAISNIRTLLVLARHGLIGRRKAVSDKRQRDALFECGGPAFVPVSGMESAIIPASYGRTLFDTGRHTTQSTKFVSLCSILGDSHGKDGRRGLEDGERQRSQIR